MTRAAFAEYWAWLLVASADDADGPQRDTA